MGHRTSITRWGRWLATFVGFPLAGVTARLVAGNIDSASAALLGGAAGGLVLGTVQAFVGGMPSAQRVRWIAATAAGLAAGLVAGGAAVDYATDTASLVVLGAISGTAVGVCQALAMSATALHRVAWAVATPALWALGWLITSQVIVDAERQHAVFGSSGALTVSALAGLIVVAANTRTVATSPAPSTMITGVS